MVGNFGGIIFCEKLKEGSRSNFRDFNSHYCRVVGHTHRDLLISACACAQTAESTMKITEISTPRKFTHYMVIFVQVYQAAVR